MVFSKACSIVSEEECGQARGVKNVINIAQE
jgi:hypothetical protein